MHGVWNGAEERMIIMKCPYCGKAINPAAMLGSIKSEKKAISSAENGKKGGRPKLKKTGHRR